MRFYTCGKLFAFFLAFNVCGLEIHVPQTFIYVKLVINHIFLLKEPAAVHCSSRARDLLVVHGMLIEILDDEYLRYLVGISDANRVYIAF